MAVIKLFQRFAPLLLLATAGCGGPSSANQRIEDENARVGRKRDAVYPLAGQVLIDGLPAKTAKGGQKIIVMLNDVSQPDAPLGARHFVECNREGRFAFNSYLDDDGVPPGHYIVTIAELTHRKKRGYSGPDLLKNLYNDPEKNANVEQFKIDHKPPGKRDYTFDLRVDGEEPVTTPGPKSLTAIAN
jgi:hypothetical protein